MDPNNPNPNPNPNPPAAMVGADGKLAEGWLNHETIPQDLRADKTLATVKDLPGMASMLVNAQKTIGRLSGGKGFAFLPAGPDDKDGLEAFYKAAGRPDTPDGYPEVKLPADAPREIQEDPEGVKVWRQACQAAGLTPTQFESLTRWAHGQRIAAHKLEEAAIGEAIEKARTDLKNDWQGNYDSFVQLGNTAAAAFMAPKDLEYAKAQGWLADPVFLRYCKAVGEAISPDRLHARSDGQADTASIQSKIDELMASKEYREAANPRHEAVTKEVSRLFTQLTNAR